MVRFEDFNPFNSKISEMDYSIFELGQINCYKK